MDYSGYVHVECTVEEPDGVSNIRIRNCKDKEGHVLVELSNLEGVVHEFSAQSLIEAIKIAVTSHYADQF